MERMVWEPKIGRAEWMPNGYVRVEIGSSWVTVWEVKDAQLVCRGGQPDFQGDSERLACRLAGVAA